MARNIKISRDHSMVGEPRGSWWLGEHDEMVEPIQSESHGHVQHRYH